MNQPWALPEGMMWRDFDSRDRSWWCGNGNGSRPMGNGVPLEECAAYLISFRLRHRETGEERIIIDRGIPFRINERPRDEVISSAAFYYTEGNLGCGCNRKILWAQAGDEEYPGEPECDQQFDITWPQWLADVDSDPCLRYGDDLPWNRAA